jgi:hypothetical protein
MVNGQWLMSGKQAMEREKVFIVFDIKICDLVYTIKKGDCFDVFIL